MKQTARYNEVPLRITPHYAVRETVGNNNQGAVIIYIRASYIFLWFLVAAGGISECDGGEFDQSHTSPNVPAVFPAARLVNLLLFDKVLGTTTPYPIRAINSRSRSYFPSSYIAHSERSAKLVTHDGGRSANARRPIQGHGLLCFRGINV